MIEINLLPEERRKKQKHYRKIDLSRLDLEGIPFLALIAGIFGVLIALQIILFFIGIYSKALLTKLENRYDKILPERKEAMLLKAQVETMNKKISVIDELMVKRFSWSKKLNSLGDSITPGIWLTELSYDEKATDRSPSSDTKALRNKSETQIKKPITEKILPSYLVISGFASSMGEEGTASIGKFIKSLKDNSSFYSDFSDIELGTIKRAKIEDQEVMSFKITCLFKEAK